jgi:anthranilate phosphoribosyltransferase
LDKKLEMKNLLEKILDQEFFTEEEAILFIEAIEKDLLNEQQIAGVLVGIQMRGLQLEEIKGFKKALLALSVEVDLPNDEAMDLCGTGGDGKNTFNISTTTSLVLAAMGKKVIKHGNYGVSSLCGSSNVLEELGFTFSANSSELNKSYKEQNIAFLHAPLFHPTMKKVAPIRKKLGIRTLFNAMGPLVNPVQPAYQMTGTFSLELAKMYQHVLKDKRKGYKVVYGLDGYDELTLTDQTRVLSQKSDYIRNSNSFEVESLSQDSLFGGSNIHEAAELVRNISKGSGTAEQTTVVAANVAESLLCFDDSINLGEAFQESKDFILSGQTAKHFKLK